ncbi:MAG: TetR/AcrR family transcriptional regulator [Beijerinckiaceae bacterium]
MRTESMKERLLEATLKVLESKGYLRANIADIAASAGVTRGAVNHHFRDKDDLVSSASRLMLNTAAKEISKLAEEVSGGRMSLDDFLDVLWKMYRGRLFMVTLEFMTEARHNEPLRTELREHVRHFHDALDAIWVRFFENSGVDHEQAKIALNTTLCLLRGMGLQSVLRSDKSYFDGLLTSWKGQLRRLIAKNPHS